MIRQTGRRARRANPVKGRRLPASLFFARLAARTGPPGAGTVHEDARSGSPAEVRAHKRALLVSYKRDGTPVPTPVWAAAGLDGPDDDGLDGREGCESPAGLDGRDGPGGPGGFAGSAGPIYVRTERTAGKVKRLRRDSRLLLAPCTMRGRPLGAPFEARARVLDPADEPRAERALADRYGLGRALFEWAADRMRVDMCYLEITVGAWDARPEMRAATSGLLAPREDSV